MVQGVKCARDKVKHIAKILDNFEEFWFNITYIKFFSLRS